MADLDNCDVANSEIEDLDSRLFRGISHKDNSMGLAQPPALFYAARYWAIHIVFSSTLDSELLDALSQFCNDHLFHWLELLSLIGSLAYSTQSALLAVVRWSEVSRSYLNRFFTDRFTSPSLAMVECVRSANCFTILCVYCKRTQSLYGPTHCMSFTPRIRLCQSARSWTHWHNQIYQR
jgi:hypothetical protein